MAGTINAGGYLIVRVNGRRIFEHRRLAELALGRALRPREHVHHINGQPRDNRPANLLICTHAFHNLLHQRIRSLNAVGDPGARPCRICGEYEVDLSSGWIKCRSFTHRACDREQKRILYRNNPEKYRARISANYLKHRAVRLAAKRAYYARAREAKLANLATGRGQ